MGWALIRGWALINSFCFRMGAYSRWALIRGWALNRINAVNKSALHTIEKLSTVDSRLLEPSLTRTPANSNQFSFSFSI